MTDSTISIVNQSHCVQLQPSKLYGFNGFGRGGNYYDALLKFLLPSPGVLLFHPRHDGAQFNRSRQMIELIVGGARSGKSRYALECGELSGRQLHFIATAQALDGEMTRRIEQHQLERDARWHLIEEPIHLASKLSSFSNQDCVVIDCLSLWLSNCLCSRQADCWEKEKSQFIAEIGASPAKLILVSNEVGQGVVPDNPLARTFIDESGWLHQRLAQLSDKVTIMHFGLAQTLKS